MRSVFVVSLMFLPVVALYAQQTGQPDNISAIKQIMINPNGFNVDWNCDRSTGRSFISFREENSKFVVDINNYLLGTCKSEAKLNESGFTFDGCRDSGIAMTFDAKNKDVPFKGQGSRCSYEFKAR